MATIPEIDRYLGRWIGKNRIPGVAFGLTERGKRLLTKGYGFRDRQHELPATTRTIFGIASMTKSVTAAAVMRLQEDRKIRVADPLSRHLPEFRLPEDRWTRKVRLEHLLTHTSGLPPLPTLYYSLSRSVIDELPFSPAAGRSAGIDLRHPRVESFSQLMQFLATARYRALGPPGAQFSYSNEGFALLGAVIERVSGRSYESYLDSEILQPAGMRRTTFDPGILLREDDRTTLYSPNFARRSGKNRPVASSEWWETTAFRPAGGLRSNVDDLLQYLEIFRTEGRVGSVRVLETRSVREMTIPRVEALPGEWYGYGLRVSAPKDPVRLVSHEGGLKGVASAMGVIPAKGLAAVALSNKDYPNSRDLVNAAFNGRLGRPFRTPFESHPKSAEVRPLREFEGRYGSGEGWWAKVVARARELRVTFDGIEVTGKQIRLRPRGGDLFAISVLGMDRYVGFRRDRKQRVTALCAGWRIIPRRTARDRRRARTGRIVW